MVQSQLNDTYSPVQSLIAEMTKFSLWFNFQVTDSTKQEPDVDDVLEIQRRKFSPYFCKPHNPGGETETENS